MALALVTGGAGFIGSHIVHRLLNEGYEVRVLDNLSTGNKKRLEDVINRIEFLEGDLRNPDDCCKACKEVDVIFHQAALPSVPRSVSDPATFHENNIDGTFQLLLVAREQGCRRLIYAASSSAYGDQPTQPKREDMIPSPLSPYALNKLVGEYYASVFSACYGLETVSLRYFNVFGPRQDPHSQYAAAIPAFVRAILSGEQPTVYGDGEQTRDFTYVENVVQANLLAARAGRLRGEVLNVACGESITINRVVEVIAGLLGRTVEPNYAPPRTGDVLHSWADISRAREVIGYEPLVTFEDGLRQAIEWYKENLL